MYNIDSARAIRRKLLNATPYDGCLLVFNANHTDWRKLATEVMRGMVSIHNIGKPISQAMPYKGGGRVTDLYITWRE